MIERHVRDLEVKPSHPTLIRWGAVFAAGAVGIGVLVVLSSLWLALAYGSGIASIREDLAWYLGGSAVMALFLASYLAGWMQGVRGWVPGTMAGLTLWSV